MKDVTVVVGAGSIGQAIARRISAGRHVVLADLRRENADAAAKAPAEAGFDVTATTVNTCHPVNQRIAQALIEDAACDLSVFQGHPRQHWGENPFER